MNTSTSTTHGKVNWRLAISWVVTYMFMIGTAVISFTHIVTVSRTLGLSWEAWTVPFLIDGIAVLGLVGRKGPFSRATKHAGLVLVTTGGALSLTCNVMAGHTLGQKAYGVLIVGGFVLTEWYAGKLAPDTVDTPTVNAKRSAAAVKAAATRKANKEAATVKVTRKPRAPRAAKMADLEAAYAMPSAPVSPAA